MSRSSHQDRKVAIDSCDQELLLLLLLFNGGGVLAIISTMPSSSYCPKKVNGPPKIFETMLLDGVVSICISSMYSRKIGLEGFEDASSCASGDVIVVVIVVAVVVLDVAVVVVVVVVVSA